MVQSCLVENAVVTKKGTIKNVIAWPANSSATTSLGSFLPVAAITTEAHLTQIIEPANANAAIAIVISTADIPI